MSDSYLSSDYNPFPASVTDSLSSLFSSINTTQQGITNYNGSHHIGTTAISPNVSNTSNPLFPIREHGSIEPNFRIDLTKSENGGFVIQVYTDPTNYMYKNKPKVYICSNVDNLGVDIQNALVLELLKG
jgi:hypothetical protein